MAFNDIDSTVYYLRTSTSLTSHWSLARQLDLQTFVQRGDSQNLVFLSDGSLRFYISSGNSRQYVMWSVDSQDLGLTWSAPRMLDFAGFGEKGVNWANFVRVTDPNAIASLVAAGHVPRDR